MPLYEITVRLQLKCCILVTTAPKGISQPGKCAKKSNGHNKEAYSSFSMSKDCRVGESYIQSCIIMENGSRAKLSSDRIQSHPLKPNVNRGLLLEDLSGPGQLKGMPGIKIILLFLFVTFHILVDKKNSFNFCFKSSVICSYDAVFLHLLNDGWPKGGSECLVLNHLLRQAGNCTWAVQGMRWLWH